MARPQGSKSGAWAQKTGPRPRVLDNKIRPLTGKEVCDIIKTAREANVSYCKINDLVLEFGDRQSVKAIFEASETAEVSKPNMVNDDSDDLSTLMIEDPVAYEKALMDGELQGGYSES